MTPILTSSRKRLSQAREANLRAAIKFASDCSPWYRKRLSRVQLAAPAADILASIPIMTKQDLMENWDEIVTDSNLNLDTCETHLERVGTNPLYLDDRYMVISSGSSSNNRGIVVYDWYEWASIWASAARWRTLWPKGGDNRRSRKVRIALIAAGSAKHASIAIAYTFKSPFSEIRSFPVTRELKNEIREIQLFAPDMIIGYPSAIHLYARAAIDKELLITPQTVISTSESLLPMTRSLICRAWNPLVINTYGVSEFGNVAYGCGHTTSMHVNEDLFLIEAIDARNRIVSIGSASERILITDLQPRRLLPLFRYELSDQLIFSGNDNPCTCGSPFQSIESILGRTDDVFHYGDVIIHPHTFEAVMCRYSSIAEYRIKQTPKGILAEIRLSASIDMTSLAEQLDLALQRAGIRQPQVQVESVPHIDRSAAGKLLRYIPLR